MIPVVNNALTVGRHSRRVLTNRVLTAHFMPRDELQQPLRKKSLTERLWAKRPHALVLAFGAGAHGIFVVGATWWAAHP